MTDIGMTKPEQDDEGKHEKPVDYSKLTPLEQARAALEHVKHAPISPGGMPSPEEAAPTHRPKGQQHRAYLDTETATKEDIEAFARYLRDEDD